MFNKLRILFLLQPYFANLTASNFSIPITLAAGDVLSVSYSISVGE